MRRGVRVGLLFFRVNYMLLYGNRIKEKTYAYIGKSQIVRCGRQLWSKDCNLNSHSIFFFRVIYNAFNERR